MYFYQGGLDYKTLMSLPIPKLFELKRNAERIVKEEKENINKEKSKAQSFSRSPRRN